MWITRTGHEDPFDFRRAHWVDTLHRWFDHELQGLANGIMDEPKVDVELAKDVFETAPDWPVPGSALTDVFLQGIAPASAGAFGLGSGGATDTLSWTDANFNNEGAIINTPLGQQTSRRVFLSPRLKTDLRISGTPVIDIEASVNGTQTNLGAALVEYGPTTQVSRSGDGIANVTPEERDCWGESSATDSACYAKVFKPETTQNVWRVTKGILDTSNRESLLASAATPITIDQKYRFRWPTFPHDYVFKAGNQIGLVLIADYTQFGSIAGTGQGRTVTLDTKTSKMQLPIVGGATAAAASGAFVADTEAPVFNQTVLAVDSTSPDGRTVDYPPSLITDSQDPSPTVSCTPPSGSMFAIGTTVVSCTATDANGNTSTGTFNVVVSFIDEDDGDVDGEVPATLNLAVGNAAPFSRLHAGAAPRLPDHDVGDGDLDGGRRAADRLRPQRDRDRPHGQRRVRAAAGAAGQRLERRRRGRRLRGDRRLGGADAAARVRGPGQQRLGDDRLQAVDRRERRAPHGQLRQDADVHALHDVAVT